MFEVAGSTAWFWVLLLSVLALILLILVLWRRGKIKRTEVERDRSGLFRYHKETHFNRRAAYDVALKPQAARKEKESANNNEKLIAVFSFNGDLRARQHTQLAKIVDEIVLNSESILEVIACVNSGGGTVPHYGHAYAEMERIRQAGLKLTVCVDVAAASGGYLMALPATKIIAAPFAVVGSVGVLAFVPNVRKLLLKHDIVPRTFLAGNRKRPIGLTDEASAEEEAHFQTQLEMIHKLFISAVKKYRPDANHVEIESGDHWTAAESIERGLGLVDELGTSNDYILKRNREHEVVFIETRKSRWEDGIFGRFVTTFFDEFEARVQSFFRAS